MADFGKVSKTAITVGIVKDILRSAGRVFVFQNEKLGIFLYGDGVVDVELGKFQFFKSLRRAFPSLGLEAIPACSAVWLDLDRDSLPSQLENLFQEH